MDNGSLKLYTPSLIGVHKSSTLQHDNVKVGGDGLSMCTYYIAPTDVQNIYDCGLLKTYVSAHLCLCARRVYTLFPLSLST